MDLVHLYWCWCTSVAQVAAVPSQAWQRLLGLRQPNSPELQGDEIAAEEQRLASRLDDLTLEDSLPGEIKATVGY